MAHVYVDQTKTGRERYSGPAWLATYNAMVLDWAWEDVKQLPRGDSGIDRARWYERLWLWWREWAVSMPDQPAQLMRFVNPASVVAMEEVYLSALEQMRKPEVVAGPWTGTEWPKPPEHDQAQWEALSAAQRRSTWVRRWEANNDVPKWDWAPGPSDVELRQHIGHQLAIANEPPKESPEDFARRLSHESAFPGSPRRG